jgi:hypothetical protein
LHVLLLKPSAPVMLQSPEKHCHMNIYIYI